MVRSAKAAEWVLLSYRLPREPSAPRLALWRRLKRLGVGQVSDGLVALPADARTREQLEWAAQFVEEAGGRATLWLARPAVSGQDAAIVEAMNDARADEYAALASSAEDAANKPAVERERTLNRLRGSFREIRRRDFFAPAERDHAEAALENLAQLVAHDRSQSATGRPR